MAKHDLQVTDDHFTKAADKSNNPPSHPNAVKSSVQYPTVTLSKEPDASPTAADFLKETTGKDRVRVIRYPREESNL